MECLHTSLFIGFSPVYTENIENAHAKNRPAHAKDVLQHFQKLYFSPVYTNTIGGRTMMKFVLVDCYLNCQPKIYWTIQYCKKVKTIVQMVGTLISALCQRLETVRLL